MKKGKIEKKEYVQRKREHKKWCEEQKKRHEITQESH